MKDNINLNKKMASRLFLQAVIAIILYLVLGAVLFYSAEVFFSSRTWTGDELLYRLGKLVGYNIRLFITLYLVVGCLLILWYYWKRPFKYLQELIGATQTVYDHDDTLVVLSPQLSEIEAQLNQIKYTNLNNVRIAKEAEQRKNDLVTYLAHDLKTPITSVIGYLTLLRDEGQISEELRQHYLSIALDKAERLDDLINEFFDITRFNISHIVLEKKQVHLTRMLNQLIYEFDPMLKEKNLTCLLTAPEDIMISCDADKLQRVFDNLLRNAVNYSYSDSSIRISALINGVTVNLTFENDGDTIPEEKLSRIFEQFYRLDTSRGSKSGGAGLGLAIAKEIVDLHGGTITAFSGDNLIRFEVTLPLS